VIILKRFYKINSIEILMKIIPNSNKIKVDSILFVSLYHCIIIGCATKNTMDILKNE
jgi:hypothetical protein